MARITTKFLRTIFKKSRFWIRKLKSSAVYKNCKVFKFKSLSLSNRQIAWLRVFLRDAGVAILSGAILGAVIENLAWIGVSSLLSASFVLCYTSFILTNKMHND